MKYRDHTGSLADSLRTAQEFSTVEEIIQHLNDFYNQFNKEVEEVKFEYAGYDERVRWDTYYVLQRLKGETFFTIAGMSDGCFQDNKIKH